MDSLDDWFEYAMDLNEDMRAQLLAKLAADDPALARRLREALAQQVRNPDFLCQTRPPAAEPDRPDRLHHVTLQVGDVDRAARWYVETFRCETVHRDARRVVVAFGDLQVHLVRADLEPPSLTLVRPDVAEMGPSTRRPDGVRMLRLVDPWGNVIEVVDRDDPDGSD